MDPSIIPLAGISVGIIVPLAVFFWLYHEAKNKNETILEISKNLDDPIKLERLLRIFDERKKEPVDYRRGGLITIFVGVGFMAGGYFLLNSGEEITEAVEDFEGR